MIRDHVISRPRVLTWMRRGFAAAFVGPAPSWSLPIGELAQHIYPEAAISRSCRALSCSIVPYRALH